MEDLAEFLKKKYCGLYKKQNGTFSTLVDKRVNDMNEKRKNTRHETVFAKRKIPPNMSPVVTPLPKKEKPEPPKERPPNKRMEMLMKWRTERAQRKEMERKTAKPVFKVAHVPVDIGLPNLDTVNTQIKGVPFKSKFAPPNHKFKPPANIKPIHLNNNQPKGRTEEMTQHRMVTRSQTRTAVPPETQNNNKQKIETSSNRAGATPKKVNPTAKKTEATTKNVKATPKKAKATPKKVEATPKKAVKGTPKKAKTKKEEKTVEKEENKENLDSSLLSPDYPIDNLNSSESDVKTPQRTDPPLYISPFVTVSRGKDSARKEFEARKSRQVFSGKKDVPANSSPSAGAAYFTWLLNNEILRLQEFCNQWTKYKTDIEPPEEATSMIDVAIGQTNLLINKKFAQFRGLIEKCSEIDAETPVSCEDLHGFWDMMNIQINNLNKRFENLDNLKANNWQEIIPEVKKVVTKKKNVAPKNVKASASLREAIQAARKKKQTEKENNFDIAVKTPINKRCSNRISMVKSAEKSKRQSSPGLMMMKVAQFAKSVETPGKSILKDVSMKSNQESKTKTVLFYDDIKDEVDSDCEMNKGKTPKRRSVRLSKNILF